MKKLLMASLLASLSLVGVSASAQVTGNFQSTAKLESKCFISAQDISFGQINIMTYSGFGTGVITVLCSKSVAYKITPTGGVGTITGYNHLMRGSSGNNDALLINLAKDTQNNPWDGASSYGSINGNGTGANSTHNVFARLVPNYNPKSHDGSLTNTYNYQAKPDTYTTTVTALITY